MRKYVILVFLFCFCFFSFGVELDDLRYGWHIVKGIDTNETTIFVSGNTRKVCKQVDIIPLACGVSERCIATKISTTPTFLVDPPLIVESWVKSNSVVVNGINYWICYSNYYPSTVGVYIVYSYTTSVSPSITFASRWISSTNWVWTTRSTWPAVVVNDAEEIVINSLGWFISKSLLTNLDVKIKALVPNYIDEDNVNIGYTNISFLTVTGLWHKLGIGDGTNKFTREPAFGTNEATFGDYPWQVYIEDLEERYKVLNALRFTAPVGTAKNGSYRNASWLAGDMDEYEFTNKVSGITVSSFTPSWVACANGLEPYGNYTTNTAWGYKGYVGRRGLTWAELKIAAEWDWYFDFNVLSPYREYLDYHIVPTNYTMLAAMTMTRSYIEPGSRLVTPPYTVWWDWHYTAYKQFSTWVWFDATNEYGLTNMLSIWIKPLGCPVVSEEQKICTPGSFYNWPYIWSTNIHSEFEEAVGVSAEVFFRVENSFIRLEDNAKVIEFGSDEEFLPLIAGVGSFPPWCASPTPGVDYDDNRGSVGQIYGACFYHTFMGERRMYAIQDWDFKYCRNKYW